jgi:uncharacterized protein YjbJ (UPF0337 family)
VKDKVGEATGDRDMEAEGEADRASGNIQEGFGTPAAKSAKPSKTSATRSAGRRQR